MRILFFHMFNLNSGWGGSASMMKALHGALTRLGHTVQVVSARRPDRFGMTVCEFPFSVELTFGPEKRAGEATIDELTSAELEALAARCADKVEAELFAGGLPDLILANHINLMGLVAWRLAKKFCLPYRVISYGTDTQLLLRDPRYCELFGQSARDAQRIFTISAFVAREVEATVGGRIEVLGGAVDTSLFYLPDSPSQVDNTLVYFGRLVSEKGLWPLLKAFELQTAATSLKIVGEGPLRADLEAFLAQSLLRDRVQLVGYVQPERMREVLIGAALAVVPSIWEEPLGLVVLEAMACGLPVVASAVGGIPEMVRDGINGRLVPAGDVAALAGAIDQILGNREVYEQMKAEVRRTRIPAYQDLAAQVIN